MSIARGALVLDRAATPSSIPRPENVPMAKSRGDFTDILVSKGLVGADQIEEARALQQSTGAKLADALVKLNYVTPEQVVSAQAEHAGVQYVDLTEVTIPQAVVELVPESLARENVVLP